MNNRVEKYCPLNEFVVCKEDNCQLYLKSDNEKVQSRCTFAVIGMELSSIAMSLKIIVDLKTRA